MAAARVCSAKLCPRFQEANTALHPLISLLHNSHASRH